MDIGTSVIRIQPGSQSHLTDNGIIYQIRPQCSPGHHSLWQADPPAAPGWMKLEETTPADPS